MKKIFEKRKVCKRDAKKESWQNVCILPKTLCVCVRVWLWEWVCLNEFVLGWECVWMSVCLGKCVCIRILNSLFYSITDKGYSNHIQSVWRKRRLLVCDFNLLLKQKIILKWLTMIQCAGIKIAYWKAGQIDR